MKPAAALERLLMVTRDQAKPHFAVIDGGVLYCVSDRREYCEGMCAQAGIPLESIKPISGVVLADDNNSSEGGR